MHICIVQPWMDYLGGAQILAFDIAKEFKKQGNDISIITTKFNNKQYKNDIKVYETGDNEFLNNTIGKLFPIMEFSAFFSLNKAKSIIKRLKPDKIIVTNYPFSLINGKNVYWYCLEAPFALYPEIVNPIAFKINPSTNFKYSFFKKILRLFDKRTINKHNRIIAMSKRSNYFLKKIYDLPKKKIINPGVNIEYYDKIHITKKQNKIFNFLIISRIHSVKNIILAIKAFKELKSKNASLTIVGTGPELKNLKRFSKHYNLDIKFKGQISEKEKIELYNNCNAVLFPCLYEPFGLVPVEAMLCKKPVIAINEWGPTETIVHNKTGLLVNNTVREFSKAMEYLINNPKVCKKMGLAGRKRAEKEFTIKTMVDKLTKFMEVN